MRSHRRGGCGDAADVIENPVLNLLPNPLANLRTMETQAVAVAGEVADADDPIARNALDEARQRPPGKPSSETLYNVQDKGTNRHLIRGDLAAAA